MGKNKHTTTSWYPTNNYKNYAYASSLQYESSKRAQEAFKQGSELLESAHSSLSSEHFRNRGYSNLNALWKHEREAERAFIEKYLKIDLDYGNKTELQQIIQAINFILQSREHFEATIASIKQFEKTGNSNYQTKGDLTPIYNATARIIPQAIQQVCNEYVNKFDINKDFQIIATEIYDLFQSRVGEEIKKLLESIQPSTGINPYQELVDHLNTVGGHDKFVTDIFNAYGIDRKSIATKLKKAKANNNDLAAALKGLSKNSSNQGGNAAEVFVSWFASLLKKGESKTIKIDTANLNMQKADLILLFSEIDYDPTVLEQVYSDAVQRVSSTGERSKRLQNAAAVESMLDQLDKARTSVVEISEKSYSLSGNTFNKSARQYGGFKAESPNIQSLERTLSQGQMSPSHLSDLIFLLVNSGDGMINKRDVDDALHAIAINIASFLFDDAVITEDFNKFHSSSNVIHVFNLNGVLIPLSVFLEGVYYAFDKNADDLLDYIVINFYAPRITPNFNNTKRLDESDWTEFYNARFKGNVVNIHFFGDFIEFVKRNI